MLLRVDTPSYVEPKQIEWRNKDFSRVLFHLAKSAAFYGNDSVGYAGSEVKIQSFQVAV
jgi:hypothetical protein